MNNHSGSEFIIKCERCNEDGIMYEIDGERLCEDCGNDALDCMEEENE